MQSIDGNGADADGREWFGASSLGSAFSSTKTKNPASIGFEFLYSQCKASDYVPI
jgi:hypothetical protein